ncbi:XRE family transcriptional regulator [Oscillospiraceae bacterium 44-34]
MNVFYQVVTLLDISVDRFFFTNRHNKESKRRQRIDMLLDSLDERELSVIEATAEGLKKSREIESGK